MPSFSSSSSRTASSDIADAAGADFGNGTRRTTARLWKYTRLRADTWAARTANLAAAADDNGNAADHEEEGARKRCCCCCC